MLLQLRVVNYALIEDLTLNFSSGLNILSGETGAGKSIVIGAINLLLGERAAVDQIRQGHDAAYVEGMVSCEPALQDEIEKILEKAGIKGNDELIIAREIFRTGRSVARVNGRAVPVSFLKEIGQLIVDLHGQHQHQSLLRPDQHLELLDSFGGVEIISARKKVAECYDKWQVQKKELARLGENSAERERNIDISAFQLKEIREAELYPGEDLELSRREKILANAEKICTLTARAYADIYAGEEGSPVEALVDRLKHSTTLLTEAAGIDQSLSPLLDLLETASAQLEEVSHFLRDYQLKLEFEPDELAAIQDRQNQINSLKRKYGGTIEETLAFAARLEEEIERLKNSEALAEQMEKEIAELEKDLFEKGSELSKLRRETAARLEGLLEECLEELALHNASFKVMLTEKDVPSARGFDQVEFLFSANPGEDVKPLVRIISGGEVSRVMLALKTILARQDLVPTLIFDEVDSGVGGATVQKVAEKLAHLAHHHQVMCVTHSAQIASMADCHFRLYKETTADRTLTRAVGLKESEIREELARMLDGASIDQVSLQHVDNLLERAQRFKEETAN